MTILSVQNVDLKETVQINSNKFTDLLEINGKWKHTHSIVVIIGEFKFKCDSEEKLNLLSSVENPNDLKKCKCNVITHYGYVIAYEPDKDGIYNIEISEEMAHCDNCHNIWDGNAQCNCYGISYGY